MARTHANTARAYQRRRKASLRARGLCSWCGRVPPAPSRTRCEACLEISRANSIAYLRRRRAAWKELGICGVCGIRDAMPNQTRCGYCAERQDDYKAMRRAQREAAHA